MSLDVAKPASAPLLSNLLELYVHDLSEIFPVEVGPDGRFGYDRLSLYWSQPETRFAFLIRTGARLAGFALVTRGSPGTDDPEVLDVAEFFVLRGHRRSGVGRRAGLPFWKSTVREYTKGAFVETQRPGTPNGWSVLGFRSAGS